MDDSGRIETRVERKREPNAELKSPLDTCISPERRAGRCAVEKGPGQPPCAAHCESGFLSNTVAMLKPLRTEPDLADIAALAYALRQDEQRPARELAERERRLAGEIAEDTNDRVATALGWLSIIERDDAAVRALHQRATSAIRITDVLIAVAAILVGWTATLAAFYFDGSGRVNAIAVLAVLVLVPSLMLVPFFVANLPAQVVRRLPGAGAFGVIVRGLSPGRLGTWLWRTLARDRTDSLELATARAEARQRLYAGVQTWAFLRWSQWFALCFQLTAVAASLVLVVFTDLAFGWSTTLTSGDPVVDAQRVHRVTTAMAAPWSWLAPTAQPSLTLIQESRFFRAASEPISSLQAARLGGWWAFVVLTIAVYGVVPRLLTFAFASGRLRAAARAAVMTSPEFSAVLRRLHRFRVETVGPVPEQGESDPGKSAAFESASRKVGANVRAVINWSAVPVSTDVLESTFPAVPQFTAGGGASVADDEALVGRLGGNDQARRGDVVILVKGWEPPLMEFIDFVQGLRRAIESTGAEIIVLPVGLDHTDRLGPATPTQLSVWRNKLDRVGDPSLRVAAHQQEVTV